MRSEVTCPSGTKREDWNAVRTVSFKSLNIADVDLAISCSHYIVFFQAHSSTTSDWQVMFQRAEEQLTPLSLSEARKQGYAFDLTDGRLVFRTPYGQPESFSTEVNRLMHNGSPFFWGGAFSQKQASNLSLSPGEWCSSRGGPCNSVLQTKLGCPYG